MKNTNKMPVSKYQGEVDLNGFKISCAVLEDGRRIFSERSLASAFGIKGGGAYWQKKKRLAEDGSAILPEYLSAKYLNEFITNELRDKFDSAVSYTSLNGTESRGIDATVLPDICDVYITAKNKGTTNDTFLKVADNAYTMLKAFAKVGIIALVDEATGYQYERERDELQKILKAYISEELLPWQRRFPDIFYKEIFRLKGWDYTVSDIKKRPGVVGTWTNKIIYEQLPKGVLDELKMKTPKSEAGNRTARFFQSLTPDIGDNHLQSQLTSVIAVMQVSDNWKDFISKFNKLVARKSGQTELKLEDLKEKPPAPKIENTEFNKTLKGIISVPIPKKDK